MLIYDECWDLECIDFFRPTNWGQGSYLPTECPLPSFEPTCLSTYLNILVPFSPLEGANLMLCAQIIHPAKLVALNLGHEKSSSNAKLMDQIEYKRNPTSAMLSAPSTYPFLPHLPLLVGHNPTIVSQVVWIGRPGTSRTCTERHRCWGVR